MWPFSSPSEEQKSKAARLREQYSDDPTIRITDAGEIIMFSTTWSKKEIELIARKVCREELAEHDKLILSKMRNEFNDSKRTS